MRTQTKEKHEESPLDVLKELAVEGTSSLVEAQRTLLDLAQQENEIVLSGLKGHMGAFLPGVAMTDLVRRSLDTLIGVQQELLTTTSRQTLEWLKSETTEPHDGSQHLVKFASEAVETFARAQKRLLEVIVEEAEKATSAKQPHGEKPKKTELATLAREAGEAFVEAQKRLLDVMGQQVNVNVDLSTKSMKMLSPSRLLPIGGLDTARLTRLFDTGSLIGSLINPDKPKVVGRAKPGRNRKQHATATS
jgi:hypothetical protein